MTGKVLLWNNQTGLKNISAFMLCFNGSETLSFKINLHVLNQPVSSFVDDPNQTTVQYKQAIHHGELEATFQQAQKHKLTQSHLHNSE